jgi:hypothetical protein
MKEQHGVAGELPGGELPGGELPGGELPESDCLLSWGKFAIQSVQPIA